MRMAVEKMTGESIRILLSTKHDANDENACLQEFSPYSQDDYRTIDVGPVVCELFTVPKSLVSGRSALRHVVSLTRNTCSDQLNVEDSTIACNREVGVVFRAVEAGHPFIQVIYYVRIPCIIFVFDSQPKSCVDQALKSTADIMCIFLYRLSDGGKREATFSPVSHISSGEFRIRCHQIFRLYSRPSPGAVFHRLPKLDVLRFFILI